MKDYLYPQPLTNEIIMCNCEREYRIVLIMVLGLWAYVLYSMRDLWIYLLGVIN